MPSKDPEKRLEANRRWRQRHADERRSRARELLRARRAEFMAGKSCVFCGATERLEIDHIDPSQKVTHRVWWWSKARRDDELKKCRVLCSRCHSERHAKELRKSDHGSKSGYMTRGCRCAACVEWKKGVWRRSEEQKRRKKATERSGLGGPAHVSRPPHQLLATEGAAR